MKILLIYLTVVNIASFILYGIDKRRAIKHLYRISEKTLLISAFVGGSVGAFLGMMFFRHKTKHPKFYIGVPLCILFNIVCLYLILHLLLNLI